MKTILIFMVAAVTGFSGCPDKAEKKSAASSNTIDLLTSQPWQVDELIHNVSGENSHYIRGSKNTTNVNYDLMQFRFKKNGTGTHTDQYGQEHITSWQFDKKDGHTMHLVVHLGNDLSFTWRMVEIGAESVYATTAIDQQSEDDILESFRLTPVR